MPKIKSAEELSRAAKALSRGAARQEDASSPRVSPWAELPDALLAGARREDLAYFKEIVKRAALRLRMKDGTYAVRSAPLTSSSPFITLQPLQTASGSLREDIRSLILDAGDLTPAALSGNVISRVLESPHATNFGPMTELQAAGLELLLGRDPVVALGKLLSQLPILRVYRLVPSQKYYSREFFWRYITAAQEHNLSWKQARAQKKLFGDDDGPRMGISPHQPSVLVSGPLTARAQPLAAVFTTARNAHLIAIPYQGAFTRPTNTGTWPSASGTPVFSGWGEGVYRSRFDSVPDALARDMLASFCVGANRLVAHLTDPSIWIDSHGVIDPLERNIASSTVEFGLGAVHDLARDWGSGDTIWTAFRAIGVLLGIWQGTSTKQPRLQPLLDPANLKAHAIAKFEVEHYQAWAMDVVDNYTRNLLSMYPGEPLETALDRVADLRNLLHGTGAPPSRRRDRLDALKGTRDTSLILEDVAVFWWAAVLMSPATHCIPASPPLSVTP